MKKVHAVSHIFIVTSLIIASLATATVHFAPQLIKSPDDLTYELGSTGNQLVWQFRAEETGDLPSLYTVQIDGSDVLGHTLASWQDNVDIVVSVDNLTVGDHSVTITVNDTGTDVGYAPAANDLAIVTVVEPPPTSTKTTSPVEGNLTITITKGSTTIIQTTTLTKLLVETSVETITESITLPFFSIYFLLFIIFGINIFYRKFKV